MLVIWVAHLGVDVIPEMQLCMSFWGQETG